MRPQLRVLFALLREQKRLYAAGIVFVAIGIAAGLGYPYFVQRLIDEGVMQARVDRVNVLGLLLLGLLLAEGISTAFRDYFFNVAAERVMGRLRQQAFDHLLRQEIAFFDSRKSGELTARLWSDVPAIGRVVGDEAADAFRFGLFGVCGTALLFYTSPLLTAIVMLAVPPIVIGSSVFGRRVKRLSAETQAAFARAGAAADESIGGIRTVRAFAQEDAERRRYRQRIDDAIAIAKRKIFASGAIGGISFAFGELAALLAIWVGGALIVRGRMTTGQLIGFVLYAFLVARGFRNATAFHADALRGLGATEWIFQLLEREPMLPSAGGEQPTVVRDASSAHDERTSSP
jgi:ATP-binding cassette subfamily B protein